MLPITGLHRGRFARICDGAEGPALQVVCRSLGLTEPCFINSKFMRLSWRRRRRWLFWSLPAKVHRLWPVHQAADPVHATRFFCCRARHSRKLRGARVGS